MHINTSICLPVSMVTLLIISACSDISIPQQRRENQPKTSIQSEALKKSEHHAIQHAVAADEQFRTISQAVTPVLRRLPVGAEAPMQTEMQASGSHLMHPTSSEKYQELLANPVKRAAVDPVSTFSIDVDTGSYANVRRFLQTGSLPPQEAVRVEELLNYFSYEYPLPEQPDAPFSTILELGRTPWNPNTRLLHIGIKGYEDVESENLPVNLVFLIDTSGSMNQPNKLGLLKSSLKILSDQLTANDTISLVTYAGSTRVVLEPTSLRNKHKIHAALELLSAAGSTNGEAGIRLAYQQAELAYKKSGVNRVILATDGDFNVGISDIKTLKKLIAKKRDSGIALTTLGFGTGNFNDYLMEQLADTGNGNYAYIDTLGEARKVLVDELTSTLFTIAKDVKIQIEFNPALVEEYRLIGYRNRLLRHEEFNNDRIDAGDIGAGHTVTALYEIALKGEGGQRLEPLRYLSEKAEELNTSELAFIKLRYKLPGEKSSRLISQVIEAPSGGTVSPHSENFRFSAAVAAFGQLLDGAEYLQDFSLADIRQLGMSARGDDRYGYRSEFLKLVSLAEALQPLQQP